MEVERPCTTFTFGERTLQSTCSIGHCGGQCGTMYSFASLSSFIHRRVVHGMQGPRFLIWRWLNYVKIGSSGRGITEKAVFLMPTRTCRVPGRRSYGVASADGKKSLRV